VKITGDCGCTGDCGRRATYPGPPGVVYSEACARRWRRAGSPPGGVPAPRSAITGVCGCAPWCGRRASARGPGETILSKSCRRRWVKAGRPEQPVPVAQPEDAPPPAASPIPDWDEPDPGEIAARWGWGDPEVRRERAIAAMPAFVDRVWRRDRQAVEILASGFTDWGAWLIVLAECADPAKVAAMAAGLRQEQAGRAGRAA
jgi:hypothetical protein